MGILRRGLFIPGSHIRMFVVWARLPFSPAAIRHTPCIYNLHLITTLLILFSLYFLPPSAANNSQVCPLLSNNQTVGSPQNHSMSPDSLSARCLFQIFATLITAQNTVPPPAPQPSFLQKKGLLGAAGRGGVKPGCVRFLLVITCDMRVCLLTDRTCL